MDAKRYRATHYNYRAWQIEELVTPGKDSKKQKPYWRIVKYPGDLQNAVSGLLDLHMGDFTIESVNDVRTALNSAESRIIAALEDVFQARDSDG